MRLLIDFGPHPASARNDGYGIAWYTLSLAREMIQRRANSQLFAMVNTLEKHGFEELRQECIRLLPTGNFFPYQHPPLDWNKPNLDVQSKIATAFVNQVYQTIAADIIFHPAFLEGYLQPGISPTPNGDIPSAKRVVLLHNLFPPLPPEQNPDHATTYKTWLTEKQNNLKYFDLILTTSETTRQDAIRLLGLAPEKVVNISDTVNPNFQPISLEWATGPGLAASAQRAWEAIEALGQNSNPHAHPAETTKPKIAFFSPLPPEPSEIAIHAADILPYLSEYFEIDVFTQPNAPIDAALSQKFKIFPHTQFPGQYQEYATAVYHIGNTPGQPADLLNLQEKFPGVVVLHDFFLQNAILREPVETRALHKKQKESHGLSCIIDYALHGKSQDALENWPLNWTVLRHARELIIHTHQQEALLQHYYGNGWHPNAVIIKPWKEVPDEVSPAHRLAIREKLGIQPGEFVVCSFGAITPNKMGLLTLKAFAATLQNNARLNMRLIFVGDFEHSEPYSAEFKQMIAYSGLQNKIVITGLTDYTTYKDYFIAGDIALQLCVNNTGEMPYTVLDCMAHGLPTIINTDTHHDEYEEETIRLPKTPTAEALEQVFLQLYTNEGYRREKSIKARGFIQAKHNPTESASMYAKVIHRAILTQDSRIFAPVLEGLAKEENSESLIRTYSEIAAANFSIRRQPKIYIDVTATNRVDYRTGIQRVVKNISKECILANTNRHFELVYYADGQMREAFRFTEKLFDLPAHSLPETEDEIVFGPGDILFIADSHWDLIPHHFGPIIQQVREKGGKIVSMVYDLLPIQHPDRFPPALRNMFAPWANFAITQSDMLVCISRTVADEVIEYIRQGNVTPQRKLDVNYIHLGANISPSPIESSVRKSVEILAEQDLMPVFLMVGIIELRKGYNFVIDAFDHLWSENENAALCIAGNIAKGWGDVVEKLEQRMRTHPQLRKKFFFIENPSDAEINILYGKATALVSASIAEGFGLPIVEATLRKVPVVASDIPVFREVGGEGVFYFSIESPLHLANTIKEVLALSPEQRQAMVSKIKTISWKESAAWTREVLEGRRVYQSLVPNPPSPEAAA